MFLFKPPTRQPLGAFLGIGKSKKDPNRQRRDELRDLLEEYGLSDGMNEFLRHTDVKNETKQAWQEYYYSMAQKYGQSFISEANAVTPPRFIGYDWEQKYLAKLEAQEKEKARLRAIAAQNGADVNEILNTFSIQNIPSLSNTIDVNATGTAVASAGIGQYAKYAVIPIAATLIAVLVKKL